MSREYDYHKPHRSHLQYEARRKRFIFLILLIGGAVIALLLYLNLNK